MRMVIHSQIRVKRIIYLIGQVIFLNIMFVLSSKITCPFKKLFHIPCPFCGMTRSFLSLLNLNFNMVIYYNILFLPFMFLFFMLDLIFVYEIVNNHDIITKISSRIDFCDVSIILIILFVLSILVGILHGI